MRRKVKTGYTLKPLPRTDRNLPRALHCYNTGFPLVPLALLLTALLLSFGVKTKQLTHRLPNASGARPTEGVCALRSFQKFCVLELLPTFQVLYLYSMQRKISWIVLLLIEDCCDHH
jgi:hypothetical protein